MVVGPWRDHSYALSSSGHTHINPSLIWCCCSRLHCGTHTHTHTSLYTHGLLVLALLRASSRASPSARTHTHTSNNPHIHTYMHTISCPCAKEGLGAGAPRRKVAPRSRLAMQGPMKDTASSSQAHLARTLQTAAPRGDVLLPLGNHRPAPLLLLPSSRAARAPSPPLCSLSPPAQAAVGKEGECHVDDGLAPLFCWLVRGALREECAGSTGEEEERRKRGW